MTILCAYIVSVCAAALFEVNAIPVEQPGDRCFFANLQESENAYLFILGKETLRIFPDAKAENAYTVNLSPGTSAVDVADIDRDGTSELLTICGDQIIQYELSPEAQHLPETLFKVTTQFSALKDKPFLHVMVVWQNDLPYIALPCESTLELRTPQGALAEQYPIGLDAPHRATYGRPFSCVAVSPPQYGNQDALEFRVNRMIAYEPDLPESFTLAKTLPPAMRLGTPRQLRDAAKMPLDAWPWFPLRTNGAARDRVLYAVSAAGHGDTLLHVQRASSQTSSAMTAEAKTGPERRYPGQLILTEQELPDFNGDGFTDVLLWKAPEPAPTVDALTRAVLGAAWPVRVAAHLFAEDKNRYSPKAAGSFTLQIPIAWFFASASDMPLKHVILRDFDGDGRTDVGCSLSPERYALWLFTSNGFSERPDFQCDFKETLREVALTAILDRSGRTTLALRGETALHVLRCVSPPSAAVPPPLPPNSPTGSAPSKPSVAPPTRRLPYLDPSRDIDGPNVTQ